MNVSEYIVDFLSRKGVKDVFLLEGSACVNLILAAAHNKNMKYYCPHHEQAGAFAVDGYYKATGKIGVMIATSGPGGQNLINGIAASFYDSCPAFYITGQVNSRFLRQSDKIRQRGFQENDIISMVKTVTKYAKIITDVKDVRYEVEKAYYLAVSGRPGPVVLDIPIDIQRATMPKKPKDFTPPTQKKYDLSKIPQVLEMLYKAQRPVIHLGGGIWLSGATELARGLSAKLGKVPFFVTWNMIDFYDPKHNAGRVGTYGGFGRNFGVQNSDLYFAIGSRVSGRVTGGMLESFARGAKKIIVDIDRDQFSAQDVKGDLNIACDARVFIETLLKKLDPSKLNCQKAWLDRCLYWRDKYSPVRPEYFKQKKTVNPYVFVKILSDLMPSGEILIHEAGGNTVVTSQAFIAKPNQRVFSNNGNSSLGYALPAAIGAAIGSGKNVNCITGDGGLNFNIQEFETLKYLNLPVKVLIFNNNAFGITKAFRDEKFNSEYAGVDKEHGMSNPDFIKVAKAYGLKTVKINNHKELKKKLNQVLKEKGPVVCDIDMEGFYQYQPKLGWQSPIEDQYPFLPRDEFRENMIIDPLPNWENPRYP